MLNFTIKLISDAGFQVGCGTRQGKPWWEMIVARAFFVIGCDVETLQGEITSISTAAQQIEVFSRILKTSVTNYLNSTPETLRKNLGECAAMVCHGQHTYVYAQVCRELY